MSENALVVRWHPRAHQRARLRWRRVAARHWHLVRAGRARRARLAGLRSGARYLVELRFCARGTCTRWSHPLRVRTRTFSPASGPPGTGRPGGTPPGMSGCPVFPADNAWNRTSPGCRSTPARAPTSRSIGASSQPASRLRLRPATTGSRTSWSGPGQPRVPITLHRLRRRERPGPVPDPARRAGRGRAATATCSSCRPAPASSTSCSAPSASGDGWDGELGRGLRPALRTRCAPRAGRRPTPPGLPIFPGLVRYDEVASGHIDHALRFTVSRRRSAAYIHPATHYASSSTRPEPARRWACACA